ncbi:unnamed protein product [Linum trigynum]|uniref:Uncharacterized protein n=1 Tax=Linum trigynum TaxID=586398 RepID=A0AAV2EVJ3_9ROSI
MSTQLDHGGADPSSTSTPPPTPTLSSPPHRLNSNPAVQCRLHHRHCHQRRRRWNREVLYPVAPAGHRAREGQEPMGHKPKRRRRAFLMLPPL